MLNRTEELAEKLCQRNAPLAVKAVKEVAVRGMNMSFDDVSRFGEALRAILLHGEDSREGPLSFVEKRAPNFKGK